MEQILQTVLLGLIQGLTEFLPISSSAHLLLPAQLLGWEDQGLAFDVAVHLGSLLAVVGYFRYRLRELIVGSLSALRARRWNQDASMTFYLVVATVPAGLCGLLLQDFVAGNLRTVLVIGLATLGFGLLLGLADYSGTQDRQLNLRRALVVGAAQTLAIIPGTSRSGITMTAALFCGLDRQTAARFSFLLSIPLILAAGTLQGIKLASSPVATDWGLLLTGMVVSAVAAYLSIGWFLRLVERLGFLPFVIYRCALGGLLLYFWMLA
jgi:undecaprenyl-diphosphatase